MVTLLLVDVGLVLPAAPLGRVYLRPEDQSKGLASEAQLKGRIRLQLGLASEVTPSEEKGAFDGPSLPLAPFRPEHTPSLFWKAPAFSEGCCLGKQTVLS